MSGVYRSKITPIITIVIGFILLGFAVFISFYSGNLFSAAKATPPMFSQDIQRISPDEAKNELDNGEAIFVDVRDQESYMAGHIPGALSIPLNDLEARMDELPKDKLIITY
jgi:hypothetical protein